MTHPFGLTDREVEMVELVVQGLTNPAIGGRLFVSKSTVRTTLLTVATKMRVGNGERNTRVQIAVAWVRTQELPSAHNEMEQMAAAIGELRGVSNMIEASVAIAEAKLAKVRLDR